MAATKGRSLRVKVSTTAGGAGTYNIVAGIENATFDRDGTNVDVTTLTDGDIVRIQAMKDAKFTLNGNYDGTDTNGQVAIEAAYDGDTELWVEFLPDGTTGWKKQVRVSKITLGGATKTQQTIAIELEGTGATAAV